MIDPDQTPLSPEQIKQLRETLARTQAAMAKLFEVTPVTWCRWEHGGTKPRGKHKIRLIALYRKYVSKSFRLPEEV